MSRITKAEKVTKLWVEHMWESLVDPGKERGSKFDEKTWDIEEFVEVMILANYARSVPKEANIKARKLARKLWEEKIEARNVRLRSIVGK
jgi:hypothetical protein